jgi:hypothetical protein
MKETDVRSWRFWSGKYGRVEALTAYYPELAARDMRLALALAQIQNAEAAIDARMAELIEAAGGEYA